MEDIQTQIEELRAKRRQNQANGSSERTEKLDRLDRIERGDKGEKREKKDEGILGVFTFQSILAIIIAIIFILSLTFYKPQTEEFSNKTKDILENDFSFKDNLYENVGAFFTYLNSVSPIEKEETEQAGESEETINQEENADEASEDTQAEASEKEVEAIPSGVGGELNPAEKGKMPKNVTLAPVIYTGSVTYPIAKGRVTSGFDFRNNPIYNVMEFHSGIDIASEQNSPILAVADGVVIRSDFDTSLGNFIKIDHGNDFVTVYGHCSKLIAKEGMKIRQGEVIAKVGSTGDSTGPHLHFGAKKDDVYFNPEYLYGNKFFEML